MADFRSRYQPPVDQIIEAARAKASVRDPMAVALDSGMKGLQQGIALSETIGNIQEKRRQRKAMADLLASPEFNELNSETAGMLAPVVEQNPAQGLNYIAQKAKLQTQSKLQDRKFNAAATDPIKKLRTELMDEYVAFARKGRAKEWVQQYGQDALDFATGKKTDWMESIFKSMKPEMYNTDEE